MNSHICRSIALLIAVSVAGVWSSLASTEVVAEDGWGTLKGRVVVSGDLPLPTVEPIDGHPDQSICVVNGEIPNDDNIVIGDNGGLRDVYVMMYVKGKGAKAPIHPSYAGGVAVQQVSIDNVNCRFVPHAVFVKTGRSILLKNSDSVGHNCHITTFNNEHNVNLPSGAEVKVTLDKADKVPGQVKCDIHKWMDGVVLVRDNPYVAITDGLGNFEIKNIPAGHWEFQFWHKSAGYMKALESGSYKFGRRGQTAVTIVDGGKLDLGRLGFPTKFLK